MRDIRVYVEGPLASGRRTPLSSQAAQHVIKVLRLRSGAALTVFDGSGGEYRARLELAGRGDACVEVGEHLPIERESPLAITLLQGLARGERMDWVVQKATELGVQRIVPVATARSVVQLDADRGDKRSAHWRSIAASACEQCGRNTLPEIDPPQPLGAALQSLVALPSARETALRLVLHPESALSLQAAVSTAADRQVVLLVGPEGGLEESETELALANGFQGIRLGPRILRTETAGLAALAALQCLAGDLA